MDIATEEIRWNLGEIWAGDMGWEIDMVVEADLDLHLWTLIAYVYAIMHLRPHMLAHL